MNVNKSWFTGLAKYDTGTYTSLYIVILVYVAVIIRDIRENGIKKYWIANMHAQIVGNQINNTILLKHKLERTDKRVENNKLYPVHILSNQMRKKKKYSLFFRDYKKKERRRRNCLHMKSLEMKQ